ncbi:MAG: preprotein translocase subunit SecE [Thermomicrobiales bacterium]
MSSPRQSVIKAQPAVQSRSEAVRPPKPTVQPERGEEASRSAYSGKFDQLKKQWFDTVAELKKVTWPDKETTKNLTLIVIGLSVVLGLLLGGIDWVMQRLFALL